MENHTRHPTRQANPTTQNANQGGPGEQRRLSNGRLVCHHPCTEKSRCGHSCCRDGLRAQYRPRPHRSRPSRARHAVRQNPGLTHPSLQRTPINNQVGGNSTPLTQGTPSSATLSADNPLNGNMGNWLAHHFPPTYFMENPIGSGRFVVLTSMMQRRPEGMPTVFASRADALSGGLTEVWEVGVLEEQRESETQAGMGRMNMEGHHNGVTMRDNSADLAWEQWNDLQMEMDRNRGEFQCPTWTSKGPPEIPQSVQTSHRVQPAGYRHQSLTFEQLLAEIGEDWDQYGPMLALPADLAAQGGPQLDIQPAAPSSSTTAGTPAGTTAATPAATPQSPQLTTNAPPRPQIRSQTRLPPIISNTSSPLPANDQRNGLEVDEAAENQLYTNGQLNEMLGGTFF